MHWTDIVRRKLTLFTLGAWRVKTSQWGPHNKNLVKQYLGLSSKKHHQELLLPQHASTRSPTQWNARPPNNYCSQQYAPFKYKIKQREGRGKIRNSLLCKEIHQLTTHRAQIKPLWFGSDVSLTSRHQNL